MISCNECSVELSPDNTYRRSSRKASNWPESYYRKCKTCYNKRRGLKFVANKQKQIDYKGGCCQICQYDGCMSALEFHHIDPNEKDIEPTKLKHVFEEARWKPELDKCVLLCSNCHREVHAGLHGVVAQQV